MRVARSFVAGSRRFRGGAAIELAVLLPVLVILVLGCVDFGRFAYTYITVTNAARAGAGSATATLYSFASNTSNSGGLSPNQTWQNQTTQVVANEMGSLSGFSADSSHVTVTASTDSNSWNVATVQVKCGFNTIISWPGIPASMTVTQTAVMRFVQ